MLKKWLTAVLLVIISLLLATIAYLLYANQNHDNASRKNSTSISVSSSNNSSSRSSKDDNRLLSVNKLANIFYKRYPDTSITSIELEKNLLSSTYEINGVDDNTEYTLKIHADTGKVISHSKEQLDSDEKNGILKNSESIDFDNIISLNNAVDKAINAANGNGGSLNGWSLEKDDQQTYWEIILKNANNHTSVKLNAQTGKVLEIENDD